MIVAVAVVAAMAQAAYSPAAGVLHNMEAVNASVKSYEVRCHFDASVRTFITLPLALDATYYFKQPDHAQLVFDSVPTLAKRFQDFYASTGTPATWPKSYWVSLQPQAASDLSGMLVLRLIPKKQSNLEYVLMTVDPKNYGVVGQQWMYKDGSSINVTQSNEIGASYVLPKQETADFNFPRYKAHVVADFGEYQINAPVDDSVFTK